MPQLFGFAGCDDLRGPAVLPGIGFPLALFGFLDDPVGRVLALQRRGRDVVPLVDRNPAIVCVFGHERAREVLSDPARFRHDEHLFDGPPGSAFGTLRHALVALNGARHRRHALRRPVGAADARDDPAEGAAALRRGARVARPTRGNIMHARHGLAMRVSGPGAPPAPPLPVCGDVHELVDWSPAR